MFALPSSTPDFAALAASPAMLRLRQLEARIATRWPMGEEARRAARALRLDLRRAIAMRPNLSYGAIATRLDMEEESAGENYEIASSQQLTQTLTTATRDLRGIRRNA